MSAAIPRCLAATVLLTSCATAATITRPGEGQPTAAVSWQQILLQPPEWYGSEEARRVADNVLLFQRNSGGWPKDIDMTSALDATKRAAVTGSRGRGDATIDNGATTTQIRFLARVVHRTKQQKYRPQILDGINFLLAAQYGNGGWPQYFPLRNDYSRHITFNDDAMIRVMSLLREIGEGHNDFAFIEPSLRRAATAAVARGVSVILAAQVRVDGRLTAWCAQHDERTLAPRGARSYEHPSLSGRESVAIVRFLMALPDASPAAILAIERAVAWFADVKLEGIRVTSDGRMAKDPKAPPLWARFYEIGTNRPIFSGRDAVVRYSLDEIEEERRLNYSWFGPYATSLLARDYPEWRKRLGRAGR